MIEDPAVCVVELVTAQTGRRSLGDGSTVTRPAILDDCGRVLLHLHRAQFDAPLADETSQDATGLTPDRAAQYGLFLEMPKHARHPETLTPGMDVDVVGSILPTRLDGHCEGEVRREDGDGGVFVSHVGSAFPRALGPDPIEAPLTQTPHVVATVFFQDDCDPCRVVLVVLDID